MIPLAIDVFREVVRAHGDRVAIELPPTDSRITRAQKTYAELFAEAEAIGRALSLHVGTDKIVALQFPRDSFALYAAQLGCWIAGAAFVVLDEALPRERRRLLLQEANAALFLHSGDLQPTTLSEVTCLTIDELLRTAVAASPSPHRSGQDLAYLIFTSGTTGKPKGVMIEQASLANLIQSDLDSFGLLPGVRVAQCSAPIYDSSIEETWLALAAGGTLIPLDDDTLRSGPDLKEWLRTERIEVFCPSPTVLRSMGPLDCARDLPDLKLLYVGGEALTEDLVQRYADALWLENGYGPTECTVTVIRGRMRGGAPVTIGRPIRGHCAYVLDEAGNPLPDGEAGELWIGGPGLARGYLNDPALTNARFVEHPEFGRIYRTGDLARQNQGEFRTEGRADSQVKIRGHRIELEEVEAALAALPGVREAGAFVEGNPGNKALFAMVVLEATAALTTGEELRARLLERLPEAYVPARIATSEALPRTAGGKRDRKALALLFPRDEGGEAAARSEDPLEALVQEAFQAVLGGGLPALDQDFFLQLGGDSLRAAMVVTRLRESALGQGARVRELYEAKTAQGMAECLRRSVIIPEPSRKTVEPRERPRLWAVGCGQLLVAILQLGLASALAAKLLEFAFAIDWTGTALVWTLALSPAAFFGLALLWTVFSVLLTVLLKRILIGRYEAGSHPAFGDFHFKHWIITRAAAGIPFRLLAGTEWYAVLLRCLGARIGRDVHIHRGVDFGGGGWDLLSIGDGAIIGQEVALRTVSLRAGRFHLGPIAVGEGAVLEVRAGLAPGSAVQDYAELGALSSLPEGSVIPAWQRYEGVPAQSVADWRPRDSTEDDAIAPQLSRHGHALAHVTAVLMSEWLIAVLGFSLALSGLWASCGDPLPYLSRLFAGQASLADWLWLFSGAALQLLFVLLLRALFVRWIGPHDEGRIARRSFAAVRLWLATGGLTRAGDWLSGTLAWPVWLRLAGMRVGRDVEISTIIDVAPGLVSVGSESFYADGIYLGGPEIRGGGIRLSRTSLSSRTFLGNHVVIPPGAQLSSDLLLGIATVADPARMEAGSAWFGMPPMRLPRREVIALDRRLTHEPGAWRYAMRVFFEALRLTLPGVLWLAAIAWLQISGGAGSTVRTAVATFLTGSGLVFFVFAAKWLLLGRVQPGQHGLWSGWCARWDFVYMLWGRLMRPVVAPLEATPFLPLLLRAFGAKVAPSALLGGGFAQLVDPDMLTIEPGATFSGLLQAHSFEDRVLKIDRIRIERDASFEAGAIALYGARLGENSRVLPHGVVMKHEHLLPGRSYEGSPVQEVQG